MGTVGNLNIFLSKWLCIFVVLFLRQDARLGEGMAKHREKEGLACVVKYVGDSVTAKQCARRWHNHIRNVQREGVRRGEWSDHEVH